MGKFRKKSAVSQSIPTAALPDIIFILLFFFMVATKMRKADPKVVINEPIATQIQGIPETMETIDLFIGKPKDATKYGSAPLIQAGDKFIKPAALRTYISSAKSKLPRTKQSPGKIIINIKMDEKLPIGILIDVKQELRKMGFRNLNYTALKQTEQ